MSDKIYLNDVGTVFTIDMDSTITAATVRLIYVRKPDGTEDTWTATASDVNLLYTIASGDLDQSGIYKANGYVASTAGGWYYTGKTFQFRVYNKYE